MTGKSVVVKVTTAATLMLAVACCVRTAEAVDWVQEARLGESFWNWPMVAIDEDTVLMSMLGSSAVAQADVYTRGASGWALQQGLSFGPFDHVDSTHSVAVSGDTAVIGGRFVNSGDNMMASRAYFFERSGDTWTESAHFTLAEVPAFPGYSPVIDVAVSGSNAIAGVAGSATLFHRTASGWTQGASLTISDPVLKDTFGNAVAISGDTAVVGARGTDGGGSDVGGAFVFADSGAGWTQVAELAPQDASMQKYFGCDVGISGATAIVGADWDDDNGLSHGAAYLFGGPTWSQIAEIRPSDPSDNDAVDYTTFAECVAISGATAVASLRANFITGYYWPPDEVWVMEDNGSAWTPAAVIEAPSWCLSDSFAWSLDVSDRRIATMGNYWIGMGQFEGVYIFTPVPEPSTVTLVAVGLGMLGYLRRRR
jgi:hypothetical protein